MQLNRRPERSRWNHLDIIAGIPYITLPSLSENLDEVTKAVVASQKSFLGPSGGLTVAADDPYPSSVTPESVETLQLIYVSAATVPFTERELASLLLRARANNTRLGVSGLLIHHAGSFFQVLEGGPDTVATLYERIALDKRHTRVLTLARGLVPQRAFGDWSMGFVAGAHAQLEALPGFNDFLRRGFDLVHATDGAARAKDLALAFRSGRFRQLVQSR